MSTIRSHGHNCCCETCYPDDVPCPVCERALNSDGECVNDDCASNARPACERCGESLDADRDDGNTCEPCCEAREKADESRADLLAERRAEARAGRFDHDH